MIKKACCENAVRVLFDKDLGLSVHSIELVPGLSCLAPSPDWQGLPRLFPPATHTHLRCKPCAPAACVCVCITASRAKQKPEKDPPVSCLPARVSCLFFLPPPRTSHRNLRPFFLTLFHLGGFCIATASFAILFNKTLKYLTLISSDLSFTSFLLSTGQSPDRFPQGKTKHKQRSAS